MGTLNFDNLAARAQELLDRLDPEDLDPETLDALEDAAAGILPPAALLTNHRAPRPAPLGLSPQSRVREDAEPRPAPLGLSPQSRIREDAEPRPAPLGLSPQSRVREDAEHRPAPLGLSPQSRVREDAEPHPSQLATPIAQERSEEIPQETPQEVSTSQQEVTAPESEETSSHFLKKSKRCAAQNKKSGAPCRAWATYTGYCVYHDPDYAETLREMQSRGGSRSPRQVLVGEAKRLNVNVMEPGGIQALLAHSYRLNLLGALSSRQTSQLNRLLTLIVSNARNMPANEIQASAFEGNNAALLAFTDKAIQHLEGRDVTDRIHAIQDVGSKREEILKANDRFGPRPSYRSARDFGY